MKKLTFLLAITITLTHQLPIFGSLDALTDMSAYESCTLIITDIGNAACNVNSGIIYSVNEQAYVFGCLNGVIWNNGGHLQCGGSSSDNYVIDPNKNTNGAFRTVAASLDKTCSNYQDITVYGICAGPNAPSTPQSFSCSTGNIWNNNGQLACGS